MRSSAFDRCFGLKKTKKLALELMKRGFDWTSFMGMTPDCMAEILDANLKPGDTYYGIPLYGAKDHTKSTWRA